MTSRRFEKRSIRKRELSVESLSSRIVPTFFYSGSVLATTLEIGVYRAPQTPPTMTPFSGVENFETGTTNGVTYGHGATGVITGSNHGSLYFNPF